MNTTHNNTGVTKTSGKIPNAIPLFATIKATSPRLIIPHPIRIACVGVYLHAIAPRPHPIIFVKTATTHNTITNSISLAFHVIGESFNPILAKNTGVINI